MSMLAEQYEFVVGGDPDRDTVDLAVVDSATGALRAQLADRADGAGYARMLAWADSRMIVTTRHAILVSRTKAINELKGLIVAAPEQLRSDLRGCSLARQLDRIQAMRTQPEGAVEHRMAVLTLQSIAARVRFLSAQVDELDPELMTLLKQHPPGPRCSPSPESDRSLPPSCW
jgi:transposase